MHLLKDARSVRADCLVAEGQQFRYFTSSFSRRHQAHHFELTIRQGLMRRLIRVTFEIDYETVGERSADVPSPADHLRNRARQLRSRAVLGNVSRRARLVGAPGVLFLRMHAEYEHRYFWANLFDLSHDIEPTPAPQRNVDHREVPLLISCERQSVGRGTRLAEHGYRLLAKEGLQSVTNDLMVFDEQHPSHGVTTCEDTLGGTRTMSSVPPATLPVTSNVAPTRSARSRIPS